jgi:hypothetical protein
LQQAPWCPIGQGLSFSARSNDVVMFFCPATFSNTWAAGSTDLRFSFMVVTISFQSTCIKKGAKTARFIVARCIIRKSTEKCHRKFRAGPSTAKILDEGYLHAGLNPRLSLRHCFPAFAATGLNAATASFAALAFFASAATSFTVKPLALFSTSDSSAAISAPSFATPSGS